MSSAPPLAASTSLSSRARISSTRPLRHHRAHQSSSHHRRLATAPRDYFGRDDTREGSVVGYVKRDVPTLAVVTAPAYRRKIPVLTHDGAVDAVELKSVDFAAPPGSSVHGPIAVPTTDNARVAACHAYATRLIADENEGIAGTGLAARAWRRALALAVPNGRDDGLAPLDITQLSTCVFDQNDEPTLHESSQTAADDANVSVSLVRCYAAHVLASGDMARFRRGGKGRFAPRTQRENESFARDFAEQAAADSERDAAWDRVRDAINASPESKPPHDHFLDGTVTQLRVEALEAYALGDGMRTSAQKAAAEDLLGRCGLKIGERSAIDCLVAMGRWRGYEELAFARYEIPRVFPRDALAQAADASAAPPADVDEGRRKDLTRLTCYAIDGEGTLEVDDAVSAEALPDGKIRVWVHIADATRWVDLGTPMATEAETRAASGYAPRGVLPMFPLPVATDLMSLNPGSPRCAVSVTAVIDEHGVAEEYWVGTSTVVVKHAVSEEDAGRMLAEEPSKHEGLTLLMEAARRRGALRLQRGAVNVRTPECNVRVHDVDDGEGFVDDDEEVNSYGNHGERSAAAVRKLEAARLDVRVTRGDQNDVSNLVSEAMILCGELIARFGTENNVPLPYRGQNEPKEFTPKVWQEAPPGLCTEVLKRYTMRAANQGVTPRKHAGLGLDAYVQFSSPIRRYTDLLAHYQVKAFLRGDTLPIDADEMTRILDANGDRNRDLRTACKTAWLSYEDYFLYCLFCF